MTDTPKIVEKLEYKEEVITKMPTTPFGEENQDVLSVVLCADTAGSLEAITSSIPEKVKFVVQKTGDIEVSDILFAKSTGAIVLGFNVKVKAGNYQIGQNRKSFG